MSRTEANGRLVMHRFAINVRSPLSVAALLAAVCLSLAVGPAYAQFSYDRSKSQTDSTPTNDGAPATDDQAAAEAMEYAAKPLADDTPLPMAFRDVGIEEKLGDQIPLDTQFFDTDGRLRPLSDFFQDGKPVVLQLAYFRCPQLCGDVSDGAIKMMKDVGLKPGIDFEMITLSFDPDEPFQLANQHKRQVMATVDNPRQMDSGWHFLTGKEKNIKKITEAVGFNYKWNERAQQYAHAAALIVLTPDGKVSRYLYGVRYQPQTVRLSIVEVAGRGDIGTTTDRFLMFCFQYDPDTGAYTATAFTIMRLAGAVMVVVVGSTLFMLFAFERRRSRAHRGHANDNAAEPAHTPTDATDNPRA